MKEFEDKNTNNSEYILDRLYSHGMLSGFEGFGISILEEMLKNFESRELYEACSLVKKEITKKEKDE